jgi:hypothetical protein
MHVQSFPPLCAFGSTDDEHIAIKAGAKGDGSVFRIWSVTPDHSLFLRILTEPDGYASYLVASAQEIFAEPLTFLPFASRRRQRRARRLLRRWGVVQTSTNHGANSRADPDHAHAHRI